jgi:ubiquinone/menaquinone biosynthesis C-methylase UbiE
MNEHATPWERVKGPGMYPVEYAHALLNPLRNLIAPAALIAGRLGLAASDRVLEIGCGPGYFSPAVARRLANGRLTLFDAQDGMLRIASERLRRRRLANFDCVTGSAEKLPFADDSFDVAFMVTVLGEVPSPAAALDEVARVLRPGGLLSVTEQTGDPDRMKRRNVDALAARAGLSPDRAWTGMLVATFNYRKPSRAR